MATEHVYEKAKVTTTAKLVSGSIIKTSYKGMMDVEYKKGDTVLFGDRDVEVKKGQVSREYVMPDVGADEDNYELKVVAKYGKKKEKTAVIGEYTVWPKEVKLLVKDLRTGDPMKLAKFELIQGNQKTEASTDENGKATQPLKKEAYRIQIKAPLEFKKDEQTTKRNHVISVDQLQEAKFVAPDVTGDAYDPATAGGDKKAAGVRQYVNMTTASEGCDAKGSIVEFEVSNKETPNGLKDDKIYIKVTFEPSIAPPNKRRKTPLPAIVAGTALGIQRPSENVCTGYVQLAADGSTAKFKVQMGLQGGDKTTVTIGYTKDDPTDDKLIFVNWRKLGYQLRFAEMFAPRLTERTRKDGTKYLDIPDAIYNVYKTRLAAVFVEYENIKSHRFPNPPDDAPCMVTKGFLEGTNNATKVYVLDGSQNWTTGAAAFDAIQDKREIHITLCEKAYSSNGATVNPKHSLTAKDSDIRIYVPANGGTSYSFLKKTHTKVDEINIKTAGFNWVAQMDKVSANDKMKKPTLNVTYAAEDFDDWNEFQVEAKGLGPGVQTISFEEDNALTQAGKNTLKTYFDQCIQDDVKLRQNRNHVDFVVKGGTGDDDLARKKAIADELKRLHTASAKKVLFHPGVDDNGNPRTGPMSDVEIDHYSLTKMKVKLPERDKPEDPLKPGDFVGAASAAKCPVLIEFTADGTSSINGNAGSGSQLLVLKTDLPGPCASTVCHELGHSMGMTVMPQTGVSKVPTPPDLDTPKHVDNGGWYYRNKDSAPYTNGFRNLHKGGHCANGMPANKKAHEKFNGWSPGAADDVCIMWGSGGTADNRKNYCDDCKMVLKARQLDDIRSQWQGRADG
jgi:hypothetical protein